MVRKRRSQLPGEFELIHRYFAPLAAKAPLAFGLTDDAAVVRAPAGKDIVVTKDAIVEGVHFLSSDPPERVAQKLMRVSLSDLAAKGATPLHYLLATAFPQATKPAWVAAFARGLAKDQRAYGVSLIGGDTVSTPGPLTLSLTMLGLVKRGAMRRRAGARPGDRIFVTGTIGDGLFGLRALSKGELKWLPGRQRRFLIDRYQVPQPRVAFGHALGVLATAAIDVSDGLLADLGHLATASGVGAIIESDLIPLSAAGRAIVERDPGELLKAIAHGDDYEIVFTLPPMRVKKMLAIAARTRTRVTPIGVIAAGSDVRIWQDGRLVRPLRAGFTHF